MTVWFSSDQHFGHRNIIKYCNRPFDNVEQMTKILVQNHNRYVHPDDDYYCLGDFSLAWGPVEEVTPQLNGRLHLIPGNHDKCWPLSRSKGFNWPKGSRERYTAAGWEVLPHQYGLTGPDGESYALSHLPYEEDERHGDRYRGLHPISNGRPLICGHVHDSWHTRGQQFNVGVDVNDFAPVSFETITEWRKELGNTG